MSVLQRIMPARSLSAAYEAVGQHAPGFDALRLFAASAVIFHHATAFDHDIIHDDWLFQLSHGYTTLGFLAVSIFFCLSGFLVTPGLVRNGNVVSYLSRRFVRIMPLLVVVVTATVFVIGPLTTRLPLHDYFSDSRTWSYLKNVTTSLSLYLPGVYNQSGGHEVNGALWTLRFEWLCYLVLAALSATKLLRMRHAVLLLWILAQAFTWWTYRDQATAMSQPITLAHLFCYFGAGVLCWLFRERLPVSPLLALGACLALAASWATGTGALFSPALSAYIVACIGLVRWPFSSMLAKADISYGLYLLHGPMMVTVLAFWSPPSFFLLFLATLSLAIPAALLSWFAIEKPALVHKDVPARLAFHALGFFLKKKKHLS